MLKNEDACIVIFPFVPGMFLLQKYKNRNLPNKSKYHFHYPEKNNLTEGPLYVIVNRIGFQFLLYLGTGDTALTYACENGHTDVADLLLQFGAQLEHESEGGRTPLMKVIKLFPSPNIYIF